MLVSEAITILQNSELKQLAIKSDESAVMQFINLAILEIYKRFNLWEDEAVITMATDTLLYKLDGIDPNVSIDLSDKQLLMIEGAFEETGVPYVLNDELDPYAISTPQYHQIEIVETVPGQLIGVIFRCAPIFLTLTTQVLPIPPQFFEALFCYCGYKGHGSIKSELKGENNTHYLRFEAACDLVNSEGLFAQDDLASHKFEENVYP